MHVIVYTFGVCRDDYKEKRKKEIAATFPGYKLLFMESRDGADKIEVLNLYPPNYNTSPSYPPLTNPFPAYPGTPNPFLPGALTLRDGMTTTWGPSTSGGTSGGSYGGTFGQFTDMTGKTVAK
jgi:hypothetical protein